MNIIGIEMSRFYGLPCTGSAVTCDAKGSNQQAGAEGMLTGEACALAGADTILAFGCSDGAQSLSFAKVLLDCDSVGALRRLVRDDPIDATRALIDDIAAVGIGGHYLGRKSTRRFHHAGEVWQPALWQRGPFEQYEGRPLASEAAARADELLRTHEVEPLADDVVAEIDAGDRALRAHRGRACRAGGLEGRDLMKAPELVSVAPLDDLAAMRRLGVACGLEGDGRDDEGILAAWGARDGDRLVGCLALERFAGMDTANWLAVEEGYRRRGVAAALYAALELEARARGLRRLWVTARAPGFFLAQGFEPAPPGDQRDALLGGCLDCEQFGRDCEPQALTKRLG